MFVEKDGATCDCKPVDNPPAPELIVVSFNGTCEHVEHAVDYTPEDFWGPEFKNTNVAGFIGSVISMWAEFQASRHVSEFEFKYLLADGTTHTAILECPSEGMPNLLWNRCPDGDGFHSYVSVLVWAVHYAGHLEISVAEVN